MKIMNNDSLLALAFFKENLISFLTRSFHWSVWSLRWTMFHSSFCNKPKLYPQSVRFSTFDFQQWRRISSVINIQLLIWSLSSSLHTNVLKKQLKLNLTAFLKCWVESHCHFFDPDSTAYLSWLTQNHA